MSKQVVSLYIDDTSLKLLVAKGKGVKKWASLSLEPGLVSEGVITDPARLAHELNDLLHAQGVKGGKVIAGLSGLHCLYRVITLPDLPRAVLPEAVNREAERLLPVALDELYISWQIIHDSKQEIRVFLAAYPRNATNALIETLRHAGIEYYLIDLTPLALARAVNRATAIIADVRLSEADVVIMVEGVPELIRSLPLPTEAVPLPEKLSIVREELERTIKFYNSNNPEKPLDSDVPIYVSSQLGEEPEFDQSFLDGLEHPVLSLTSPLQCPEGLAVTRYMVNIGLALKHPALRKSAGLLVVNLDVQSEAYQPKPLPLAKILITLSIIVAIGLLIPVVTYVRNVSADTASIRAELDTTNQLVKLRQTNQVAQKKEIAELEERIAKQEALNNTLTKTFNNFDLQQKIINSDLEVITNNLPSTINLTTINHTGNILTVGGWTPSETEVLSYVESLTLSGQFSKTRIATAKREGDEGMVFSLVLTK